MYTSKIGKVLLSLQVYIMSSDEKKMVKECVRYAVNETKAKTRRERGFFCKSKILGNPLQSVFQKNVLYLQFQKRDKGFRSVITKRTRVYLFYANFVEKVAIRLW